MHSAAHARVLASVMGSSTVASSPAKERQLRFDELVNALLSDPPSKFDPFRIYRSHYTSNDIDIGVDILLPNTMKPQGPRPVIVRIHGGFLVCSGTHLRLELYREFR